MTSATGSGTGTACARAADRDVRPQENAFPIPE